MRWYSLRSARSLGLDLGLEGLKVSQARLLLGRAEGGGADGAETFARFPTTPFSQIVWTEPLVRLGLFQRQEQNFDRVLAAACLYIETC